MYARNLKPGCQKLKNYGGKGLIFNVILLDTKINLVHLLNKIAKERSGTVTKILTVFNVKTFCLALAIPDINMTQHNHTNVGDIVSLRA